MNNINVNLEHISDFVSKDEFTELEQKALKYNSELNNPQGKYKDYTGWVNLPEETGVDFIDKINNIANNLRQKSEILVVIGIGGSYLGAKAVIEALSNPFEQAKVIFAGINLTENYLSELTTFLKQKDFSICMISKSGTTTEPAVSFRILKKILISKHGEKEAFERIVAITDKEKGALIKLSKERNFTTFEIPDNIGGRFSVLTPVGLLPIAFAGFDISALLDGAKKMANTSLDSSDFENNIAVKYAVARNILHKKNHQIELLVNYNPKLHFLAEWWKQLFGESEGKDKKGIFPASADFTSDLHSLGQYIQDGQRFLMETVLNVTDKPEKLHIENEENDLDNLNYLNGKSLEYINQKAFEGTLEAHLDGGVPNIIIDIPKINEFYIGQLIYFFEKACGISAMLLDVHPFVQPGVEAYKSNMFRLLGKQKK
ncbi:MAG: glucose-6-phosphate isomerase [Bacteroidota bacterium]|nr:glucose-6-phosphate isomerase [Bacteroidota bacterium]